MYVKVPPMKSQQKDSATYDWVNNADRVIGKGSARVVHRRNIYTRSVHILLETPGREILIVKRPAAKKTYPNLYTSSAGGRVEIGETYRAAAKRELKEELGIAAPLTDAGRFDVVNKNERTIHRLYVGRIQRDQKITFNWESAGHRFIKLPKLWSDINKNPKKYADPFRKAILQYVTWKGGPTYIFDFDHTVFNWYKFKRDLENYLKKKVGISPRIFRRAKDIQESQGLYNIHKHLEEIARLSGVSASSIRSAYQKIARRLPSYVYKDAHLLLIRFKKQRVRVVILTYGDKYNQAHYIDKTGVRKYSRTINFVKTKEAKIPIIRKILKKPACITFIDDDPEEAGLVRKRAPMVASIVVIERPDGKYHPIRPSASYLVVRDLSKIPRS